MKSTILALLLTVSACLGQVLPTSTKFVGHYVGVLVPVSVTCTTERFLIAIDVDADYTLVGGVFTYDDLEESIWDFDAGWPLYFKGASFKTSIVPRLESNVRGTFNTAGGLSGVMDWRPHGGCLYTFRAYRQYTYNVQLPERVKRIRREVARLSETVPGPVSIAASR